MENKIQTICKELGEALDRFVNMQYDMNTTEKEMTELRLRIEELGSILEKSRKQS